MSASVVIADDHPVVLAGLAALIATDPAFEVVGQASDGHWALKAVRQTGAEIAIIDIAMPGLSGLEVAAAIRLDGLATKVVLLTANASDAMICDAMALAPAALLLKETAPGDLLNCLHEVSNGRSWPLAEELRLAAERETERREEWRRRSALLTHREAEIADLAASGAPNKAIAAHLAISEGTVKVHLNSIFRKLGATSRSDLRPSGGPKRADD
jgi:DNA-binding NarL/FixJ family response regulator